MQGVTALDFKQTMHQVIVNWVNLFIILLVDLIVKSSTQSFGNLQEGRKKEDSKEGGLVAQTP